MDDSLLHVHIASAAPGALPAPAPAPKARRRHRTIFRTAILTPADPVQEILPASDNRVIAWIQPLDAFIVLGRDQGEAGASANTVPSVPNPSGALIPNTNPQPWPVQHGGVVWAGITDTSKNCRIVITAVYED